jgi:hypothetical protein
MTCSHGAISITTNLKTEQELHVCQWCYQIVKVQEPTGIRKQLIEVNCGY